MSKFYLIRHGKKNEVVGDPNLSTRGEGQAKTTASYLKDKNITRIFSSPLKRCYETAKIIAIPHELKVIKDARLRERVNWGDLPGQTFEDFVGMWKQSNVNRVETPKVGDSPVATGKRLEEIISDLAFKYPGEEIVLVSHGGAIADFLLNVFSPEILESFSKDFVNKQSSEILECSITEVDYDGIKYKLNSFGKTDHLTTP